MEKNNEAKVEQTRCDFCSQPAAHFHGNKAYCASCLDDRVFTKKASEEEVSIKSAVDDLTKCH